MRKIQDIWHPRKGLPGTWDKMSQIWGIPYYTGRLATLTDDLITRMHTRHADHIDHLVSDLPMPVIVLLSQHVDVVEGDVARYKRPKIPSARTHKHLAGSDHLRLIG